MRSLLSGIVLALSLLSCPTSAQDYNLTVEILDSRDSSTVSAKQFSMPGSPERVECAVVGWNLECTKTPAVPPQTYQWSKRRAETRSKALIDGKPALLTCFGSKCPLLQKGAYRARWAHQNGKIELLATLQGNGKRIVFGVQNTNCYVLSMTSKDGNCVPNGTDSTVQPQERRGSTNVPDLSDIKELDGTWKGAWRSTSFSATGKAAMTVHTHGTEVVADVLLTGGNLSKETLMGNASKIEDGWSVTFRTSSGNLAATGVFKGGAFLGDYDYFPLSDHGNWGLQKE